LLIIWLSLVVVAVALTPQVVVALVVCAAP
jgi:hypothetical protein